MPLEIITVPCLSDNYAFILRETESDQVAVVDVPEAKPILDVLSQKGWSLDHILLTHHHDDHIMGVEELRNELALRSPVGHRMPTACLRWIRNCRTVTVSSLVQKPAA